MEIENLKALISGRELTTYQRSLALQEWERIRPRASFEELIFKKAFPNEEYDADRFYDWAAENGNKAFDLAIEVARDLGL